MKGLIKLHHLIHSISKTEKRYISIELSKQKSKKGAIDLKLFNLLKKQEVLEEDEITSLPEFNSSLKLIIRSKYLFDFILRCLINYNYAREVEITIGNHIRIIKNFMLKGLHEYTHYHLKKAQKLAEKYEDLYRQGILCSLRKIIITRSSTSHTHFFNEIQKIEKQEGSVHEKIINLNTYNTYSNHLQIALKKNSGSKLDEPTQKILTNTAASLLFKNEKNALTKKARIIFHEVNAIYNERSVYDYNRALFHTEKQMELIKNLEEYQKVNSPSFITCLKRYCILSVETLQFEKAKEALEQLNALYADKSISKNIFEKSLVFLSLIEAETRLTLTDCKLNRLDKTQAKVIAEIEFFDKMFDGESKMIVYFNLSLRLLLISDYKNAFRWLEKILKEHHGMRMDILQNTYVLSLLCIYEIDSVNLFHSRERSYLRQYQHAGSNTVHKKIIFLLARLYQNKNNIEFVKKSLKELEIFVIAETKKNEIDHLLGETILAWIRKKI